MLSTIKPQAEKLLLPIAKNLSFVNPNVLTILGIIPSLLFFICLVNHQYLLALLVFVGNVFDLLDGTIARINGKVTAFGGFLDSTIDRISDFVMIAAFGFAGIVRWEIIIPLLLFSYLISYARSRAELAANGKIKLDVGLIERTERLIVLFITVVFYMLLPDMRFNLFNIAEIIFVFLTIFSGITFFQRVLYAYKKL